MRDQKLKRQKWTKVLQIRNQIEEISKEIALLTKVIEEGKFDDALVGNDMLRLDHLDSLKSDIQTHITNVEQLLFERDWVKEKFWRDMFLYREQQDYIAYRDWISQ